MPNCIYCGTSIPPDIGLRCFKCNTPAKPKPGHQYTEQDYDKEFAYDLDTVEPHVSKILQDTERRELSKSSQQAKEEFCRLYEGNVNSRKEYRWPNQEELQKRREGRILHMNEFMRLLKLALPAGYTAWFTEKGGMANTLGLYVGHPSGATPLPSCSHEPGKPHYVCFVQVPFMQEYEELNFDRYNVPLGSKRRGWRTVGLKLIESGIVTESKFHEVFGEPSLNQISRRYREYLQFTRTRNLENQNHQAN